MKWSSYLSFLALAMVLIFSACSSDDTNFDLGEAYFPLEEGHWIEYELDSIIYDDFDNSVTSTFHDLRIEIGSQIQDGVGGTLTEIKRYIKERGAASDDYILQSVWFAKVQNGVLETIEENLRFVKMDLPPVDGKSWEGNQFVFPDGGDNPLNSTNFYEGWDYFYEDVNTNYSIGSFSFDNAVHVNQVDEFGGPGDVRHYIADEWYVKDVGLVFKRMEIVEENCGSPGCSQKDLPVLERTLLRKGFIMEQRLVDYK